MAASLTSQLYNIQHTLAAQKCQQESSKGLSIHLSKHVHVIFIHVQYVIELQQKARLVVVH